MGEISGGEKKAKNSRTGCCLSGNLGGTEEGERGKGVRKRRRPSSRSIVATKRGKSACGARGKRNSGEEGSLQTGGVQKKEEKRTAGRGRG